MNYLPTDVWNRKVPFDTRADIWGLGCALCFLSVQRTPAKVLPPNKESSALFLHRAKKEEKAERQIEWTKAGLGLAYVAQETLQQLAIMHGEK